jgi:hypothetical protein
VNTRRPDAAAILGRKLSTPRIRAQNGQFIQDPIVKAIGQRLQDMGIAQVPGLPEPEQPQWYDRAIEAHRLAEEPDQQAQTAPVNIVDLIRATLAGAAGGPATESVPVTTAAAPALNDITGLLRSALSGAYTVNGEPV